MHVAAITMDTLVVVNVIPLPVADLKHLFGQQGCLSCGDVCAGHYLCPEKLMNYYKANPMPEKCFPPSKMVKTKFSKIGLSLFDSEAHLQLAKITLIKTSDVLLNI